MSITRAPIIRGQAPDRSAADDAGSKISRRRCGPDLGSSACTATTPPKTEASSSLHSLERSSDSIAPPVVSCGAVRSKIAARMFAVGTLVPDLKRPVNQLDFDIALQTVFESRAAHDAYQAHPRHVQFIEENKVNWERVRVFDADVS